MIVHSPDLEQLILSIHSAAVSREGWAKIAEELCRALSADKALMLKVGSRAQRPWVRDIGFGVEATEAYVREWAPQDIWYHGALRNQRVRTGLVSLDAQLVERRDFLSSAFFNDYLRHFDTDAMINVCLADRQSMGGHEAAAISFYRGLARERFGDRELTCLSRLGPHLVCAAQTHWSIQTLGLLEAAYREALDAVTAAAYILDSSARILRTNETGEDLLRARRWVQQVDGRLAPQRHLLEASTLAAALTGVQRGLAFQLVLTEALTQAQVIVRGAPLVGVTETESLSCATALIWVIPTVIAAAPTHEFAQLFGLTGAEERLLERLRLTDDLREIADRMGLSIHTVRSQLKSIFRKTGRRSQTQLMILVSRMAAIRSP